jgi:hypothetical protein
MKVTEEYEAALKVVENQRKGLIPMLWDTKGRFMTKCGMRYSQAEPHQLEKVAFWTDRQSLKNDADWLERSERRWTLKRNPNIKDDGNSGEGY